MGAYNILLADLVCPHCGTSGEFEIEFRLGERSLREYRLGDVMIWLPEGKNKLDRKPDLENMTVEGYVECPHCGRDFWVNINLLGDYLDSVQVDVTRPGYIS